MHYPDLDLARSLFTGQTKYLNMINKNNFPFKKVISLPVYSYTPDDMVFSNSLIIHQKKTKKITTVTVVWICDPNYHKILPTLALISPRIIDHLRSHIKQSKVCFIRHPNTSKSFKKTRLRLVFWMSDETRFLMFDILHLKYGKNHSI